MSEKYSYARDTVGTSNGAIKVFFIGGIIGALIGIMTATGMPVIPRMNRIFTSNPVYAVITGIILGVCTAAVIKLLIGIFIHKNKSLNNSYYRDEADIKLHEEKLELLKQWAKTGEVNIRKEVLQEDKNIVVPVTRKELVIEKRVIDDGNTANDEKETIRIPISEERIEIIKYQVELEDVSVFKRRFQEFQHIEETLKKETIKVKTTGEISISEENPEQSE